MRSILYIISTFLLLNFHFSYAFTANASGISVVNYEVAEDSLARQFDVTLDSANQIRLICQDISDALERHQKDSLNISTSHKITLRGLKPATTYRCSIVAFTQPSTRSKFIKFVTSPLPLDLVVPKVTTPLMSPTLGNYILFNVGKGDTLNYGAYSNLYTVIMDQLGNIRWYYRFPSEKSGYLNDLDTSYIGNEQILYGGKFGSLSYRPTILGFDKASTFSATLSIASTYEISNTYHHDAGLSPDSASIFTLAYTWNQNIWYGFIIKQIDIKTNTVLWAWDSYTNGVGSLELEPGSASYTDPYHANSVYTAFENGRLYIYVGMRTNSTVLKIDYLTKSVVWALGVDGDFQLLDSDGNPADDSMWFFNQHDVKRSGNIISVYDNGYDRELYGGDFYSRALNLEIDEVNMTAKIKWEYTEDNWYELWWGGYDLLDNGNSLLTIGHSEFTEHIDHPTSFTEFDSMGNLIWRAEMPVLEAVSYRSELIDGCEIFNNLRFCSP